MIQFLLALQVALIEYISYHKRQNDIILFSYLGLMILFFFVFSTETSSWSDDR